MNIKLQLENPMSRAQAIARKRGNQIKSELRAITYMEL